MKKLFLLILPLFVLISCSNDDDDNNVINEEVVFTTIGQNSLSGSDNVAQANHVFNNQADWNNFLDQLNGENNVSVTFTETDIDFTAYTVIAVVDAVKTSGSKIDIETVIENTNNIQVSSELTIYSTAVISQAFHIIKIPKTSKQIIFN